MNKQTLFRLTGALALPSLVSCDRGSGDSTPVPAAPPAPPVPRELTTAELIFDKGAAEISRLQRVDVATNPHAFPAGHKSDPAGLGEQSQALADALKKYVAAHKKFPARIESLHPEFIADEAVFWIHYDTPAGPRQSRFALLSPSTYSAPDSNGLFMIAFTIDPIPMGNESGAGGRMIIDSNFNTWFAGEGRFYEFLCGKDIIDGKNLPPLLPGEAPILPGKEPEK